MNFIKEECEKFMKNLKNENENLLGTLKTQEIKNKKNYEEKIEKLIKKHDLKIKNLEKENEN
ncbi:hypothetical protein NBO_514g0010 [Nosema bombycis CQ1]|uniref:Uncharacterized protein n=1 Tax=Nosema bombycis (strain CQ1 / CVCC 102059) TaxID=578461 RepID=R0MDJ0_NOSB1|nr:hypothetical protein NBO_514g0010 [Nosema bombycis CQ1]|eukprot:EOB12145.1 hypothetical protein NBO_514g0010 [Nosema bombycis CQ1]